MKRLILMISVCLTCFWYSFTTTAPLVALPIIKVNAGLTDAQMQWTMTLRFCVLSCFVVLMGRISDSVGRARVFLFGLLFMIIGSILLCIGTNVWLVIIGSVILGFGASAAIPTGLALSSTLYEPELKMKMITIVLIVALTGTALGGLFGGLFAEYVDWRMIYWVSLAGFIITLICGFIGKSADKKESLRKFRPDFLGTFLLGLFAVCFIILFSEAQSWGLDSAPMISLYAVTPTLFVLLIISQFYVKNPIIDFNVYKNKSFSLGSTMCLFNQATWIGFLYIFVLVVQSKVSFQSYDSFMTGVIILPFVAAPVLVSPICLKISKFINVKGILFLGNTLLFVGMLVFMFMPNNTNYINEWWRFAILGVGLGMAWVFITPYAYSTIPKELAGHAAGLFEINRFFGNVLGICIADAWMRSEFASKFKLFLDNQNLDLRSLEILKNHFDTNVISNNQNLLDGARDSLLSGFHSGTTVCMIFAAITVVLSLVSFIGKN